MDAVGIALVCGLARRRRGAGHPAAGILLLMWLPTVVYTVVMNPLRAPAEDWDLFAHGAVLTALLGPLFLIGRVRQAKPWYGALAIILLGLNLSHTVPGVLAAHFAPVPEIRYPDVFAVEAYFRREGLRYAITDRSTHVYLRTLLRDADVRSVQFADGTLGPEGPALDVTATGAFVLVPESEAGLLPNLLALGAPYRVAALGGYRVYHGFTPPPEPAAPISSANWRVTASENPAAAPHVVDGDPGTRWSSVAPQREGVAIEIDLGETVCWRARDRPRTMLPLGLPARPRRGRRGVPLEGWREVLHVRDVVPRALGRLRRGGRALPVRPGSPSRRAHAALPPDPGPAGAATALRADSRPWSVTELRLLRPAR